MKAKFLLLFPVAVSLSAGTQVITKAQAIQDLDMFSRVLSEVHYNPYLFITADAYRRKSDSLKATLPDTLLTVRFILKLAELSGSLQDGHTMPAAVQQVFRPDFRKPIYFPLEMGLDRKGRLVTISARGYCAIGCDRACCQRLALDTFFGQARQLTGGLPKFKTVMALGLLGNYL